MAFVLLPADNPPRVLPVLDELPVEVMRNILGHIPPPILWRLRALSRRLRGLIVDGAEVWADTIRHHTPPWVSSRLPNIRPPRERGAIALVHWVWDTVPPPPRTAAGWREQWRRWREGFGFMAQRFVGIAPPRLVFGFVCMLHGEETFSAILPPREVVRNSWRIERPLPVARSRLRAIPAEVCRRAVGTGVVSGTVWEGNPLLLLNARDVVEVQAPMVLQATRDWHIGRVGTVVNSSEFTVFIGRDDAPSIVCRHGRPGANYVGWRKPTGPEERALWANARND